MFIDDVFGNVVSEFNSPLQCSSCFRLFLLSTQADAEDAVGISEVVVECDGLASRNYGFVQLVEAEMCACQFREVKRFVGFQKRGTFDI